MCLTEQAGGVLSAPGLFRYPHRIGTNAVPTRRIACEISQELTTTHNDSQSVLRIRRTAGSLASPLRAEGIMAVRA